MNRSSLWSPLKMLRVAKNALADVVRNFLYIVYYRFLFGRDGALTRKVSMVIGSWEKQHGKGDIPASAEVWDSQYQKGNWNFLRQLDELGRYSLLAGFIQHLKGRGAILDV